jgi:hypothetical protein
LETCNERVGENSKLQANFQPKNQASSESIQINCLESENVVEMVENLELMPSDSICDADIEVDFSITLPIQNIEMIDFSSMLHALTKASPSTNGFNNTSVRSPCEPQLVSMRNKPDEVIY